LQYTVDVAKKKAATFRLSDVAIKLLAVLAKKMGIGKSAVIETAIRRMGNGESL
jgi:hypothetical protein